MWRKSDDTKSTSESSSEPKSLSNSSAKSAANAAVSSASVTVNQGIVIKGEISGQGDLIVDGTFEGKVHLPDGSFTAGPHAHVTAEIEAREIVVLGEVIGTLKARERVHISSTGRLTGDMDTRGIVIEDGAILHSKVASPRAEANQSEAAKTAAREAATAHSAATSLETRSQEPARSKGAAAGDSSST